MGYSVRVEREAREDLFAAKDYYSQEAGADVADRFTDAVEAALERLATSPLAGRRWQEPVSARLEGLRVRRVPSFPYLLFYLVEDARVSVLAALHERRDLPMILQDRFPPEAE